MHVHRNVVDVCRSPLDTWHGCWPGCARMSGGQAVSVRRPGQPVTTIVRPKCQAARPSCAKTHQIEETNCQAEIEMSGCQAECPNWLSDRRPVLPWFHIADDGPGHTSLNCHLDKDGGS
jgi:hypothetical protein